MGKILNKKRRGEKSKNILENYINLFSIRFSVIGILMIYSPKRIYISPKPHTHTHTNYIYIVRERQTEKRREDKKKTEIDQMIDRLFDISKLGYFNVEECADSDPCGLNTDLQPTNTTVEMDCASRSRDRKRWIYKSVWRDKWRVKCCMASLYLLALHTQYSVLYKYEAIISVNQNYSTSQKHSIYRTLPSAVDCFYIILWSINDQIFIYWRRIVYIYMYIYIMCVYIYTIFMLWKYFEAVIYMM